MVLKVLLALSLLSFFACNKQAPSGISNFGPLVTLEKNEYNMNAATCCYIDWGINGWLGNKVVFPDAKVIELESGKEVRISDLIRDKPIVIQLASMTCPSFHLNVDRFKPIREKYKDRIDFYTLYVRENHPKANLEEHKTIDDKIKNAKMLKKVRSIDEKFLVDSLDGKLHQQLGNFGNSLYLIGKDRYVSHWSIFAHAPSLVKGIQEILKVDGFGERAKFVPGSDVHPVTSADFSLGEKRELSKYFSPLGKNKVLRLEELGNKTQTLVKGLEMESRHLMSTMNDVTNTKGSKKIELDLLREIQSTFRKEYTKRSKKWLEMNNIDKKDSLDWDAVLNN